MGSQQSTTYACFLFLAILVDKCRVRLVLEVTQRSLSNVGDEWRIMVAMVGDTAQVKTNINSRGEKPVRSEDCRTD